MEQRQSPRFPVRFRSSFKSLNIVGGDGTIVDLSLRGCRVDSSTEVRPGTSLEVRILTSNEEPPLQIQEALVRWSRAHQFGLEFVDACARRMGASSTYRDAARTASVRERSARQLSRTGLAAGSTASPARG